ncbi:glycosyltransferase family 4 protein [Gelidibacter salicanalis]|uniref:Glycosyltransferase n=1 Tax=Gelidibacter salicanalis TaxID=291193 RepID=A0A934NK36_9FLAO|nr:glycosyltransferase [Gelidibacter salicanalis]MBJ7879167.1 glycosyltransferase [Gelidibacter salicanalis]
MNNRKLILFVVHESKKSGAPLLLLQLLKEFKAQGCFSIDILINKTGELDVAFEAIGTTYFYYPKYLLELNLKSKLLRRVLHQETSIKNHQQKLYKTLTHKRYDVIYFNSLGSQSMFTYLENYPAKKVTHIHELHAVVAGMDQVVVKSMLHNSNLLISSCKTITEFLSNTYTIDTNKLLENSVFLFKDRKKAIDNLGKPDQPSNPIFRIGGCGGVEARKGTDLFVDFAIKTIKEIPDVAFEFIWVGNDQTAMATQLTTDIKTAGLQEQIKFVGSTAHPEVHFNTLNLFFLSSREEAFGLVGLENAYCQNPLVSFDINGDLPLFINQYNSGKVIPEFEFAVFKTFILKLMKDKSYAKSLGENGKAAVVKDFNSAAQATIIQEALNKL